MLAPLKQFTVFRRSHKYNAKRTEIDGIKFDSIKEANYYCQLKLRQKAGEVIFFLMQVPFHFHGVKYTVDFQEFRSDGTVHFIDVKGVETKEFIRNKKIVESIYPIEIEVIK